MTKDEERRALSLYAVIMEEIKVRISTIDSLKQTQFDVHLVHEMCFLQLRMICELIALGCLLAHGGETTSPSLQKQWSAGKIMDELSELHPDFYPVPIENIPAAGVVFAHVAGPFLRKEDLIELYGRCGVMLHRGSLKNVLDPKYKEPIAAAQQIDKAINLVCRLLSQHTMMLVDRINLVLCQMISPESGKVMVVAVKGQEGTGSTWPPGII